MSWIPSLMKKTKKQLVEQIIKEARDECTSSLNSPHFELHPSTRIEKRELRAILNTDLATIRNK